MRAKNTINKGIDLVSTATVAVAMTPGVVFMHILNAPIRLAMWINKS